MKDKVVVADAGPIISLAVVDQLALLERTFASVNIPSAVWDEITRDENKPFHQRIHSFFENKVVATTRPNDLRFVMDYGESEAVVLYQELQADYLLIDDKKARAIAENLGVRCIGTLGMLLIAREKGQIKNLQEIFTTLIANGRYYAIPLLNHLLQQIGEEELPDET